MAKRKNYNREFKLRAAELVLKQGYSMAEAARRLGVSGQSIKEWIAAFKKSGELVEGKQVKDDADERRELRKRVRQLELENEILKKAAAYFAKESM